MSASLQTEKEVGPISAKVSNNNKSLLHYQVKRALFRPPSTLSLSLFEC
jgi:hypothetical protein